MKKEILITGVAGFLGYSVAKLLLDSGYTVIGIDNKSDSKGINLKEYRLKILKYYGDKFFFHNVDIVNSISLEHILYTHQPDKILHLASQILSDDSQDYTGEDVISANIIGFFNVLEISRNRGIPLVFASSNTVYGDTNKELSKEDDDTSKATSLSASIKKSNEVMAYSYAHLYKTPIVGLRFFSVYGPWGNPNQDVYKFTEKIIKGEEIVIPSLGEVFKDYSCISDITNGILKALDYDMSTYEVPYEIFNLASGKSLRTKNLIKFIEVYCEKNANIRKVALSLEEPVYNLADISKAKRLLNYEPKISVADGIQRFIGWYNSFHKK